MPKKAKSKSPAVIELETRKKLTFEQAEGADTLPSQLKPKEISRELRAYLWEVIHTSMESFRVRSHGQYDDPWATILYDKHILRDHGMADDFENSVYKLNLDMRGVYEKGDYLKVLGMTQWILRHGACPDDLAARISEALKGARAAYALVDGDTFVPLSSEEEATAVQRALNATEEAGLAGPRAHLKTAAQELTNGNWPASIRESIHAVEAVARIIAPNAKGLEPALTELAKKGNIHGALRNGFTSLYGFTSDKKGVRHSLLDQAEATVDEADAQYMLGACASFVSYLLARARQKN